MYPGTDLLRTIAACAPNYNRFLLERIVAESEGAGRVLDFGAGLGVFAAELSRRGRDVVCVESDAELRRSVREFGLPCVASLAQLEDGSVDFIYALNVLEHIEDDAAVLRELSLKLKPAGSLYLYVPAFGLLFSSLDQRLGHFRRYRKASLLDSVRSAGFEIARAAYVDSLGFAASLLLRCCGRSARVDARLIRLYDRLVFPVSRLVDRVASHLVGKNLEVSATRHPAAAPGLVLRAASQRTCRRPISTTSTRDS